MTASSPGCAQPVVAAAGPGRAGGDARRLGLPRADLLVGERAAPRGGVGRGRAVRRGQPGVRGRARPDPADVRRCAWPASTRSTRSRCRTRVEPRPVPEGRRRPTRSTSAFRADSRPGPQRLQGDAARRARASLRRRRDRPARPDLRCVPEDTPGPASPLLKGDRRGVVDPDGRAPAGVGDAHGRARARRRHADEGVDLVRRRRTTCRWRSRAERQPRRGRRLPASACSASFGATSQSIAAASSGAVSAIETAMPRLRSIGENAIQVVVSTGPVRSRTSCETSDRQPDREQEHQPEGQHRGEARGAEQAEPAQKADQRSRRSANSDDEAVRTTGGTRCQRGCGSRRRGRRQLVPEHDGPDGQPRDRHDDDGVERAQHREQPGGHGVDRVGQPAELTHRVVVPRPRRRRRPVAARPSRARWSGCR